MQQPDTEEPRTQGKPVTATMRNWKDAAIEDGFLGFRLVKDK